MSEFLPTDIPEVIQFRPKVYTDERGFFMEAYRKETYAQMGISQDFVQDNHSSSTMWTLRGLHYQVTHTQGKLVRAVVGEIFDVAVDLRKSSPYFGKWISRILSEQNKEQLWLPPGFAHGFLVLSERADVIYKTTNYYDPTGERIIKWNDPTLGIRWPIPDGVNPIVSEKDAAGTLFSQAEVFE